MAANPTRSNEQDKQKDSIPGEVAPQTLQLVGNSVHGHNYQPCPQPLTVCGTDNPENGQPKVPNRNRRIQDHKSQRSVVSRLVTSASAFATST